MCGLNCRQNRQGPLRPPPATTALPHAHTDHIGDRQRSQQRLRRAVARLNEKDLTHMYAASCAEHDVRDGMSACHAAPASAREAHSVCLSAACRFSLRGARGSCITRIGFIGSASTRRRWPSGADCRRRTHVARTTMVILGSGPSPGVEGAVKKGELREQCHQSPYHRLAEKRGG